MKKSAIFGISTRCNLNCIFCLDNDIKGMKEFTFEEIKNKLIELKKSDVKEIIYMTCESFLRKDFFKITKYVNKEGFDQQVVSNGTLLANDKIFKNLIKSPLRSLHISISSANKEMSKRITGNENALSSQLNCLKKISEYNKSSRTDKIKLTVRIIVNKININEIDTIIYKILNSMQDENFSLVIKLIRPQNKSKKYINLLIPESNELKRGITKAISLIQKENIKGKIGFDNFPLCYIQGLEEKSRELNDIYKDLVYYQQNPHSTKAGENLFRNYTKDVICIQCKYDLFCPGVWRDYYDCCEKYFFEPIVKSKKRFSFIFNSKENIISYKELKEKSSKYNLSYNKTNITQIQIINMCNNHCIICPEIKVKNITNNKIKKQIKKNNSKKIIFNSFEPTLNAALLKIIRENRKYLNYIGLRSNGRIFSYKKNITKFINNGLSYINIKLLSTNKNIHEYLTQTKNSFEQSMQAIKNISDEKSRSFFHFDISIPVCVNNIDNIEQDYTILSRFNIDKIILEQVLPTGYLKNVYKNYSVKYNKIINLIKKFSKYNNSKLLVTGIPYCITESIKAYRLEEILPDYLREYKMKLKMCMKCIYNKLCTGIWKKYIKIYGIDEFSPILNNKIKGL